MVLLHRNPLVSPSPACPRKVTRLVLRFVEVPGDTNRSVLLETGAKKVLVVTLLLSGELPITLVATTA